jgi:cold shock protein
MAQEKLQGTVSQFHDLRALGFIAGDDGQEYFTHMNYMCKPANGAGFKVLAPGWRVEFTSREGERGLEAHDVVVLRGDGVHVDGDAPVVDIHAGKARIRIDSRGRICTTDHPVSGKVTTPLRPHVHLQGRFRAFFVDHGWRKKDVWGFEEVHFPRDNAERAFVLIDYNKNLLHRKEIYKGVRAGAYLVRVEADGTVEVQQIGWRLQEGGVRRENKTWIVLSRRFRHKYDFGLTSGAVLLEDQLRAQTPTSGRDRDNDGFIPAIMEGVRRMKNM